MAGGRPKLLDEDLLKVARDYVEESANFGGVYLPTIEGLALKLKINRDTIYAWESKGLIDGAEDIDREFSDIVGELRSSQAEKLLQFGLNGKYNATIAKLVLSKHGYVDKREVEHDVTLDTTREKIGAFLDDTDDPEDSETSESEDTE